MDIQNLSQPAAWSSSTSGRLWAYAGTFCICFALLSFEISSVRTINFTIGPSFIYIAIALAMLGLTSAGSILSLVDLGSLKLPRHQVLFWTCLAIALLLVASHFLVASTKAQLNEVIASAGKAGGLPQIVATSISRVFPAALKIGFVLGLPYFLFGGLLAFLFATSEGRFYGKLYAADLVGASIGCMGIIWIMETTSYALSVTAPAIAAALAAAAFALPTHRRLALFGLGTAGLLLFLAGAPPYRNSVEPPSDPHYMIRDYEYRLPVAEVWHRWNSFTRVGAVVRTDDPQAHATLSLANGDGMAFLFPYGDQRSQPLRHEPVIPALLRGTPKDALVLLAGAGGDLMSLHEHGSQRVVGVELNPTVLEAAQALPRYRVADFLSIEDVQLEIAEGRVFLERDPTLYDLILLSWSGATAVYYSGALGGTTQFLYTYEGLSSLLDHLKPGGSAVILQVNKVNVLAALRRYLNERNIQNPERTAVILFREMYERSWDNFWDDNPLLIKLDGWSDEEVARIRANALKEGLEVAYAPGIPVHPEYKAYKRILSARDIDAELAALRDESDLRFEIVTDDRPFYLDLFPNSRYLSPDFWFGLPRSTHEVYHQFRVSFVAVIVILALALTIGPLLLQNGPTPNATTGKFLAYFFLLGAGFMVLEIAIIQKASLLFGNPGLTIAMVLGSLILFAGLGSLMANWNLRRGLSIRMNAAATLLYIVALWLNFDTLINFVLPWTLVEKMLLLSAVLGPGAFLLGQFFPHGIRLARAEDPSLVPWAWAVNGAMSTIVAGVAPLIAQAFGFQVLFLLAAVLYGGLLFIRLGQAEIPASSH